MKTLNYLSILFIGIFSFSGNSLPPAEKYDVEEVYAIVTPKTGTLVKSGYDSYEDVTELLVPTTLTTGNYNLSITRKGSNIYRVDGHNLFLKTRFCYEYSFSQDVVLIWESNYSFTKGSLVFPK